MLPTSFKLNTGATIPAVGLGTWQSSPGEVAQAVEYALKDGYRHIDCAFAYGNEAEVGEGIKKSGVPRSEIFITSKLWSTYHSRVEENLDITLSRLGTDYVDLYLVHWPVPLNPNGNHPLFPRKEDGTRDFVEGWSIVDTWKQMEAIYKSGKAKAIGVSNWSIPNLETLLKETTVVPAANQIELHPYNPMHALVKFCQEKGIVVEAYSPLGSTGSPLLTDPQIKAIAEKHSASVGQILISYQVARGIVVLPKSVTPSRITENRKLVELTPEDVKELDGFAAAGKQQRLIKPDWPVHLLKFDNW